MASNDAGADGIAFELGSGIITIRIGASGPAPCH